MDFKSVLDRLLEAFSRENVRWALTGGFAMGMLGAARATADMDFLVHRDDMPRLHARLDSLGYRRIHHSENVSQYDHPEAAWGSLDFIHAFRPLALDMLSRALEKPFQDRTLRILKAEDVIGLKAQALANNPSRRLRELADIESLIEANLKGLDWTLLKTYFDLFSLQDVYAGLKERFGHG
jgi:hypothetical protein